MHSVNLQKRWTLFEECWHVCVKVCRILMHLESFSSLILPKWFKISKYYKNIIQNFTVDMILFIPCYLTSKDTDFNPILHSVKWIKICWKPFMFSTSPFLQNKVRFGLSLIQKLYLGHSDIRYWITGLFIKTFGVLNGLHLFTYVIYILMTFLDFLSKKFRGSLIQKGYISNNVTRKFYHF